MNYVQLILTRAQRAAQGYESGSWFAFHIQSKRNSRRALRHRHCCQCLQVRILPFVLPVANAPRENPAVKTGCVARVSSCGTPACLPGKQQPACPYCDGALSMTLSHAVLLADNGTHAAWQLTSL